MTVETNYNPTKQQGNGVTTSFSFAFEVASAGDIVVYQRIADVQSVVPSTDYTVQVLSNGGNVIFNTAPAQGTIIVIDRDTPQTQDTPYKTSSGFPAVRVEENLDKLTLMVQELQYDVNRSPKVDETSSVDPVELVEQIERVYSSIDNVDTVADDIANVNTVASDKTNVDTVSGNISNVNTVAGISGNVTTVAGISSNVTAVAGNATNINTVAGINSDVTAVAGIKNDVTAVAGNNTDISKVADDIANVNTVAGDITNVNAVAGDLTNIDAVNANKANINTVAGINSDVTAVAGIKNDVTAVAGNNADISTVADDLTNIDTVAGDITNVNAVAGDLTNIDAVNANKTNIDTVAGISSNVTTVAGIASDVTAVAGNNADISKVADDIANVNAVSGDLTNIDAVNANKTNIDTVAGIASDVTAVAGNNADISTVADDIANVNAVAADLTNIDAASGYAAEAKQWAIGDPTEPVDGSAKYWAGQAAAGQVQADWTEADTTSKAYVRNKPTAGDNISLANNQISAVSDASPTLSSTKLVQSGGVYTGLNNLQTQIDAIVASSDVFDIVANYAALQAYDITTVPVNDIVKVLVDETHSGAATYYRCVESGDVKSWSYIGAEGAYYTKGETDVLLAGRANTDLSNLSATGQAVLDAKANDSDVVKLTGDQTVNGSKTFTGILKTHSSEATPLKLRRSDLTRGTAPASETWSQVRVDDKNGNWIGFWGSRVTTSNTTVSQMTSRGIDNTMTTIACGVNADGSVWTEAPTPATSDNSTKIATTAFVINVLETIYPVGSCYIGTTSNCPLASLFGTWTLKSSGIVTSVDTSVPVKGNGMNLGLTDGTNNVGLQIGVAATNNGLGATLGNYGGNIGVSVPISTWTSNKTMGITTDASKSGIVGTVTRTTLSVNIWERTA